MARTPVEVPEELLSMRYQCPDCARENQGPKPGAEFNWVRAPQRKYGVRRLTYCRPHQSARNGQSQKVRMQKPEAKAKRRAWDRANWTRYIARRYARHKEYYARNRAKRLAAYAAWAAANPEQRKVSQDAWRKRKRLRGRPVAVRPKLRPGAPAE